MLESRLGQAVLATLCVGFWCLSHRYVGLFHDAGLYALQALAHQHPEFLSRDVFLRFGSQDRFTVFSPLYAALGTRMGLEPAAAALTLVSQLALVAGAWALARAVMPVSLALLGAAVLLAVPGYYGADRIFTCLEPFLTPRMLAQALCLGALAAALNSRRWLAILLAGAATFIHPIMAAAGIAALFYLEVARGRPRLTLALLACGGLALTAQALAMQSGLWGRFDPLWLALVEHRSPYLFLAHWRLDDWSGAAVSVITLLVGGRCLPHERARALAGAAVVTVAAGLALTAFAVDALHLVIFTQLQPWRWQWLGTVAAAVLLPEILRTLWRDPVAGRATALLLVSAWVFGTTEFALVAAAAAIAAAVGIPRLKAGEARLILWGACAMLTLAVLWRVASNLEFTDAHYADPTVPWWLRRAESFVRDGTAPLAAIAAACWLMRDARRRCALLGFAALSALGCAALLPYAWRSWTQQEFPRTAAAPLAALRDRIPAGAEVFSPDSPVGVWMMLQRPSYLSMIQTSGLVFSRTAAIELDRRARALGRFVAPGAFMAWDTTGTSLNLSRDQLIGVCSTGEFGFLATSADLRIEPLAVAVPAPGAKAIRLYRCRPALPI